MQIYGSYSVVWRNDNSDSVEWGSGKGALIESFAVVRETDGWIDGSIGSEREWCHLERVRKCITGPAFDLIRIRDPPLGER